MKNFIKFYSILLIVLLITTSDRRVSLNALNHQTDIHTHSCKLHSYERISNVENNNFPKRHIVVSSLGYVNQSEIDYSIKVIEDFYGYDCSIGGIEQITNDMYLNGSSSIIDADFTIDKLEKLDPTYKTVYLVNKEMNAGNKYLRGYAVRNGKTVLVIADKSILRETLIHEIGHSLGLAHCSDLTCVMAVNNDEWDSGTFCNECFRKLGVTPSVLDEKPTNKPSNSNSNFSGPDFYEN